MQLGMLFHAAENPGAGVYIEQIVCELGKGVDVVALEQAWQRLIDRHDVLRTTFDWRGSEEPVQRVHREAACMMDRLDWRAMTSSDAEDKLAAFLTEDRIRGFDLARPPLMRLTLIRRAGDGYTLVWTHHHAILDGRARIIVLKELGQLYKSCLTGSDDPLTAPSNYGAYLKWFIGVADISDSADAVIL
jgi:NRPS condensation-like uncharacterized protein